MILKPTPKIKEAALAYVRRGWAPIPLPARSKVPIAKGWPELRLTAETVGEHFNGQPQNIGVLLGEPSGWLIDIDLDHEKAVTMAHTYLPETQAIFGRPGKPRSHFLYRVSAPIATHKRQHDALGMIVEQRSTGCQTVFPPSIHQDTGEPIAWEVDGEPATITPEELRECVDLLADAVERECGVDQEAKPEPQTPPPRDQTRPEGTAAGDTPWGDYNARGDFRSVLVRYGWVKVRDAVPGDDNEHWRRPGKNCDHSATINGERTFYCFTGNAKGFQSQKAYSPFQVFMLLEHAGDPKAAGRALSMLGYGRRDDSDTDTSRIGKPPEAHQDNGQQPAETPPKPTPAENQFRINIVTSADLQTGDFQAEYWIDNSIPVGQPLGMFAPQKSLKTTIKADALVSLAIGPGAYFLRRFPVLRQARCLDLNGESGMGSTQEIARRICASKGVALESLDHLLWSENLPRFDKPSHLLELDKTLRGEGIEFASFDCAYLCMSGENAGNVFSQGELLRDISILCREAGTTLMLLHHTKKASISYEPPELSDAAWSGFAEFVRSWILLSRREKYVPGTGEHKLWVSIGGSLGHQSLSALDVSEGLRTDPDGRRWDVSVQNAEEARCEAKQAVESRKAEQAGQRQADDCRKMLETLRRCPEGDTITALRGLAFLSGARAADAVRALVGEGRAEQVEITKYRRKEIGYRATGK